MDLVRRTGKGCPILTAGLEGDAQDASGAQLVRLGLLLRFPHQLPYQRMQRALAYLENPHTLHTHRDGERTRFVSVPLA